MFAESLFRSTANSPSALPIYDFLDFERGIKIAIFTIHLKYLLKRVIFWTIIMRL